MNVLRLNIIFQLVFVLFSDVDPSHCVSNLLGRGEQLSNHSGMPLFKNIIIKIDIDCVV